MTASMDLASSRQSRFDYGLAYSLSLYPSVVRAERGARMDGKSQGRCRPGLSGNLRTPTAGRGGPPAGLGIATHTAQKDYDQCSTS